MSQNPLIKNDFPWAVSVKLTWPDMAIVREKSQMFSHAENQTDLYEYYNFVFDSLIVQIQIDERIHLSWSMIHQNGEMCQLAM